jgi:uncharacterized NAD-dependent epimerase/dehydratase family protein
MIFELPYRRLLILTEGKLGMFDSKTGASVMRYRPDDVVGVLDSIHAGRPLGDFIEGVRPVPVFASVAEAMKVQPDAVLIGIAPSGGALPGAMKRHLIEALKRGLSIVSGLHSMLRDDPELIELAEAHNVRLHDVRDPGPIQRIAQGKARNTRCKRVLTVGTDCAIGKMVASLEMCRAATRAGLDAAFVATGQTGIMIEGWGISVDHVLSDFAAGATEMLVEHVADRQICFIEGQGSIGHPGYSGVTLSLLHGSCPDAMVICHRPDRVVHNGWEDCPVAPIRQQIDIYERVLAPLHPGKVVAVSVNTGGMPADAANASVQAIAAETGLPTADPIRHGADALLDAVRRHVGV